MAKAKTEVLEAGSRLGSYRVQGRIGKGGMGAVYLAEHELLGSRAAIKVLHRQSSVKPEMLDRFFAEARASSEVRHPGIVQIFDFGYRPDGSAFMVMEHLEGETLAERLERCGRLETGEIRRLGRQIACALAAAHERDIVHRDLKPENIVIVPDSDVEGGERVKVLDFGVAKIRGVYAPKTRTGVVCGTPLYMAPEQCHADPTIDHRADVYALGCILFELSCGRPPFVKDNAAELLTAHAFDPPQRVSEAGGDPALDEVVARALFKEREGRLPDMAHLARALEPAPEATAPTAPAAAIARPPTPAPRRRWRAAAVVALVGIAIGAGSIPPLGDSPDRPRTSERQAADETDTAPMPSRRETAPTVTPLEPEPPIAEIEEAPAEVTASSEASRRSRPRRRAPKPRDRPAPEKTYDPRGYR